MAGRRIQMSDSMRVALLLAIAGGFLDAYTYVTRGGVFANAQTGNIVLFGVYLFEGNFIEAKDYLAPIFAFFIGIITAEMIKSRFRGSRTFHWRQIVVLIEFAVLAAAAFMPQSYDTSVNVLISFVCSLQVESFRKVEGSPFATTMCTGNLRSATEHLYNYHKSRDLAALKNSGRYFLVIALFTLGAGIGAALSKIFHIKAVLFAAALLLSAAILMAKGTDSESF
ncbi:MAG: YoaK family protein [Synergistaceae bacterium]|nr:YoaK family protein [Synergistaceae bacterium]